MVTNNISRCRFINGKIRFNIIIPVSKSYFFSIPSSIWNSPLIRPRYVTRMYSSTGLFHAWRILVDVIHLQMAGEGNGVSAPGFSPLMKSKV